MSRDRQAGKHTAVPPPRPSQAWLGRVVALVEIVRPKIIDAVNEGKGRAVRCPECGELSVFYSGHRKRDGRWHTGFRCACGFGYRE